MSASTEDPSWRYLTTVPDGRRLEIQGLDVWAHEWRNTGRKIAVKDLGYGQPYKFSVFEIALGARRVAFAAGEWSNGVWGFFVPTEE